MSTRKLPSRTTEAIPEEVAAVFQAYPPAIRERLLTLRQLILDTAAVTPGVGRIEEALRWGEPSYLTPETKSGSTVRLNRVKGTEDRYAIFFKCTTSLVGTFREMYADLFDFAGDRAITFQVDDEVPTRELGHCIALALRYHLDKKVERRDLGPTSRERPKLIPR